MPPSEQLPGPAPGAAAAPDEPHEALARHLGRQQRALHSLKGLLSRGAADGERAATGLLLALAERGPVRSTALAEAVHSDPSTVSRQTAQLVADGLVERQPDPADGRAWRLALTPAGHDSLAAFAARRRTLLLEVLRDWEPAEVALLSGALERFTASLERVRAEVADGTSPLLHSLADGADRRRGTTPDPAEATP